MKEKEISKIDAELLISKILSKNATPDDVLVFNRWLNESERNIHSFLILKEYFEVGIDDNQLQSELAFEKFEKSLNLIDNEISPKKPLNLRFIAIAASIAILIFSSIFFYTSHQDEPLTEHYTYISGKSTSQFTLNDGTVVHLNKNSKLTYSSEFGKEERYVRLDGEAYFDVSKSKIPFKVDLGEACIKVLGTKFNVKAYECDSQITTTLEEGCISFDCGKQQVLLQANEQLTYNKFDSTLSIAPVETILSTSWKEGIYKYISMPFGELTNVLAEIYNVKIVVDDRYANVVISGSFEYDMTVNQILDMIKKSLPYSYKVKENVIIIN